MSEDKPFQQNFAMLIPTGATPGVTPLVPFGTTANPVVKPKSKRTRLLCLLLGHRWGSAGMTTVGPGFPLTCKRCHTTKWFRRYPWQMRLARWLDRALDVIWRPLCKIGLHRYKPQYGFAQYPFGSGPVKRQVIKRCSACCRKSVTINLK